MTALGALPPPGPGLARAMLGNWRLHSREDHDREGRRLLDPVLGPDTLGMLSFAPGHFAAQFMKRDRESTAVDAPARPGAAIGVSPARPGANNSSAANGYDAYFGTYSVDERAGTITVRLEGALSPSDIGHVLTREIRVEGDRLIIQLETTAFDGTPVTRRLVFQRLV